MRFEGFIAQSYVSQSTRLGCEEAINVTLELNEMTGRWKLYRAAGLRQAYTAGANTDGRAALSINGHLFVVQGDTVKDFSFDGTTLALITSYVGLAVDGKRAQMAANVEGTMLAVYSGGKLYKIFGGVMTEVTWMGTAVAGVDVINDFFLMLSGLGDGFFYSEPGDVDVGDPLNFRSAEGSANRYTRLLVDRNADIWLWGKASSQVFYNDANDPSEPFKPNQSAFMQTGISAPETACSLNGRVWWIDQNGTARYSQGFIPQPFSTHSVQNRWRKYGDISNAYAWTASWNGHEVIRFTFPTAIESFNLPGGTSPCTGTTWQYDTVSKAWTLALGWDEILGQYTAHRGMSSAVLMNKQLVADRANGKIYILDPEYYYDDTTRVPWLRRAPVINEEGLEIEFPWFELGMQAGVGDGSNGDPDIGAVTPEFNPTVSMRYSNDWGQTWTPARERTLGEQGDYGKRVYWSLNGSGRQRVFEIGGSAACPIAIDDCYLGQPEALSA